MHFLVFRYALGTTYYCALPVIITAEDNLLVFQVAEATQNGSTFMEGDILMPNGYTESTYPPADGVYPKGMSFTLTKPGIYLVRAGYGFPSGGVESVLLYGMWMCRHHSSRQKPL